MTNAKRSKQARSGSAKKKRSQQRRSGGARRLWLWLGLGAVILVVVALAFTSGDDGGEAAEPAPAGSVEIASSSATTLEPGQAIPEWSAPALDGSGTMTWSDFVGEPTILAIWAPWCPHCQAELPRLNASVDAHPGVQMVTVSTGVEQGGTSSQDYLDSQDLTFPVAVDDAEQTIFRGLGGQSYPTTYFVDSQGKVLTVTQGEIPDAQLEQIMTQLETT